MLHGCLYCCSLLDSVISMLRRVRNCRFIIIISVCCMLEGDVCVGLRASGIDEVFDQAPYSKAVD